MEKSTRCGERRNRIELIAIDLDGTLLENGKMPKSVIPLFKRLARNGVKIVLVTGRSMDDIKEVLLKNGIKRKDGFPHVIIALEKFIYFLDTRRYRPSKDWNEFMQQKSLEALPQGRSFIKKAKEWAGSKGYLYQSHPSSKVEEVKYGFSGMRLETIDKTEEVRIYIEKLLSEKRLPVRVTRNVRTIVVTFKSSGKGVTLQKLTEMLNMIPERVLAIGDSQNDECMLDGGFGFRSATVDNAEKYIKNIVKKNNGYIARASDGDGVMEILKKEEKSH